LLDSAGLQPPGGSSTRAPGLIVNDYCEGKFAKHNFIEEPATWLVNFLKYFTQLDH
jgi:hypothetical protein